MRVASRLVPAAVMLLALACGPPGPGGECAADDGCRDDLECIANGSGGSQCMARCVAGDWLCANGGVCLESPSDGLVCWFATGTSYGRACTGVLECEPGTVCEGGVCMQACNVDAGVEPGENLVCQNRLDLVERCSAIAAGPNAGVCVEVDGTGTADAGVTSP